MKKASICAVFPQFKKELTVQLICFENEMIEDESDGIPDEDAGETEEEDTEDEDVMDDESDDGEIPEDEDGSEDMSVSNVAKRRKRKHRKRKTGMGKKPWIIAGSIVGALVVIYLGISAFFISHFYINTEINGQSFSGKTVSDVEEYIKNQVQDYELTVMGQISLLHTRRTMISKTL